MVFNRVKIDATRVTTCHEARFNTIERLVETRQVARLRLKPGGASPSQAMWCVPVRIQVARLGLNPSGTSHFESSYRVLNPVADRGINDLPCGKHE